jgi:transcription elongation GreA/GreB family factor
MQTHVQEMLQLMQQRLDETATDHLAQNAKLVADAQAAIDLAKSKVKTAPKKNQADLATASDEFKQATERLFVLENRQKAWNKMFQDMRNSLEQVQTPLKIAKK